MTRPILLIAPLRLTMQVAAAGLVFSIIVVTAGCEPQSYTYRYRPGSMYEYNRLIEAWIPDSGTPPPLLPASDPSKAGWVMAPTPSYEYQPTTYVRWQIPEYDSYYPPPILYMDDWFYDDCFRLGFGSYWGHGWPGHRIHTGWRSWPYYRGHRRW